MWRYKKGALEASETGEWTLFIIGFVVLLVFVGIIYGLLKGSSEEDLCKLSVLSRATSPVSAAQEVIPLKCVMKRVCFSDGRGHCDDPLRGEKGVVEVKLPQAKDANDRTNLDAAARIIEEESAKKMYECWKAMGEGRLDLFNGVKKTFGVDPVSSTCVICSRLVVDKHVLQEVLDRVDVNEYMKTHSVSEGGMTYLQAFTGSKDVLGYAKFNESVFKLDASGNQDVQALMNHNANIASAVDSGDTLNARLVSDAAAPNVNLVTARENRELAFVFMQIKSKETLQVVKNIATAGGLVAGSTFMTPVVKSLARPLVFNPLGAVVTVGASLGALGYGMYNAKQGQLAAAGYCGQFTSNEKDKLGCSMVQGVNYNKEVINGLCASIQGRLYES